MTSSIWTQLVWQCGEFTNPPPNGSRSCCADYIPDICVTALCIVHLNALISSQVGCQSCCHLVEPNTRLTNKVIFKGSALIRITPLIWIKILEASWLAAFNHFDVLLKRASLLMCAARSSADRCWLLHKTRGVCCCCISVWAGLTDAVHAGQIFMHIGITYRRKRAFLSLCSSPWSSRPHTRTCRHPPAGNTGFPRRRWLSSCPLSWGRAHHPLSSSLWMVPGCEKRQ